ncbi:hypothetical protein JCM11251_002710 [Rhodosporidiobolus azoricus]
MDQLVFGGDAGWGASLGTQATPYCLPDHPCFPGSDRWQALNESTGGKLIRPDGPPGCEKPTCADPYWRMEQPAAVQFLNFQNGQGLSPDFPYPTNATTIPVVVGTASTASVTQTGQSGQDRTPAYVLNALSASDVVHAVNFARNHKLRLRIKNTGHDYLGRSSDVGAFTLWTNNLKDSTYEPEFVPEGAPEGTKPEKAIRAGAGNVVADLYKAADEAGVVVTAGVSRTVGGAGGFVLGGGHGPFAPLHGLAADNVLEFLAVTANGTLLRTSPYQHPTLFTALRGGGSAFAVIVETVFRAHEPPAGFVGIFGQFYVDKNATKEEGAKAWAELMKRWVDLQPVLSEAGPFAGYTYVTAPFSPEDTPFAYILPSPDLNLSKSLFEPVFDWADGHPHIDIERKYVESETWYPMWHGPFTDALESLDSVGISLLLGSRLIPKDVVEQKSDELSTFLAESHSPSIVHLVAGGKVQEEPSFPSSVHPAWRKALLHIDLPISWTVASNTSTISALTSYLTSHTLSLGRIASSLGAPEASYSSESDYHEAEWQKVWYGEENYERLLRAKKEWDPEGVFNARNAVGSEIVGW